MFGKSTSESFGTDRHGHSVIQEGVTIRGDLEAKGDFRLDGRIEGRLTVSEKLTVGGSGVVVAEIDAAEVIVMGEVQGTIHANRRLEMRKGARIVGDVTTPILVIEEGVHFHGNSNMETDRNAPPKLTELGGLSADAATGESHEAVSGKKAFR